MLSNKLIYSKKIIFLLFFLSIASCKYPNDNGKNNNAQQNPIVVFIQPLGNFDIGLAKSLQSKIQTILSVHAMLTTAVNLPSNAWYAPRHRYWADSILFFLQGKQFSNNIYVLGITEEDISTKKGLQPNWGVMGLGFQPGNCCIVSTYRLYKYPQTQKQLLIKLLKVSLHELGHNFGLPHCTNTTCIMADAKGKDHLDTENDFCKICRKTLAAKGLKPITTGYF